MSSHAPDADQLISTDIRPSLLLRCLVCMQVISTIAWPFLAYQVLNLHCESFGCMGIGVAWFAWGCAFAAAFFVCALLRYKLPSSAWKTVSTTMLWLQIATGVLIGGRWIFP